MAARGLGKGLDSLIPNALGETKTKKETTVKSKTETTEEKEPQTLVIITKVEPNREQPRKILTRMLCRSWQILLSSLVCCSRFWYRTAKIITKSLPVREDGVQQSWQV